MKKALIALSLLLLPLLAFSEDDTAPAAVPEPPDLPPQVESGAVMDPGVEPEVTIVESEKGTEQRYSVHGRVYMVKVIPSAGPPYYLLDTNGDGQLDAREDSVKNIAVPQWVLFSW